MNWKAKAGCVQLRGRRLRRKEKLRNWTFWENHWLSLVVVISLPPLIPDIFVWLQGETINSATIHLNKLYSSKHFPCHVSLKSRMNFSFFSTKDAVEPWLYKTQDILCNKKLSLPVTMHHHCRVATGNWKQKKKKKTPRWLDLSWLDKSNIDGQFSTDD